MRKAARSPSGGKSLSACCRRTPSVACVQLRTCFAAGWRRDITLRFELRILGQKTHLDRRWELCRASGAMVVSPGLSSVFPFGGQPRLIPFSGTEMAVSATTVRQVASKCQLYVRIRRVICSRFWNRANFRPPVTQARNRSRTDPVTGGSV